MFSKVMICLKCTLIMVFVIVSISILDFKNSFAGKEVPVLMYHHISKKVTDSSIVSPKKLFSDMKYLRDAGYEPIFLKDLDKYIKGKLKFPSRPIIITFDDGYYSNYKYAYPLAKKMNMKINIAIIGWSVGNTREVSFSHFNWEEAEEMILSGIVDIQNHTYDLHSPEGFSYGNFEYCGLGMNNIKGENPTLYERRIVNDLIKFDENLRNHLGYESSFIIYPYGVHSRYTENIIENTGYDGTLTTVEGIRFFRNTSDLKRIPRLNITEDLAGKKLINRIKNLKKINFT